MPRRRGNWQGTREGATDTQGQAETPDGQQPTGGQRNRPRRPYRQRNGSNPRGQANPEQRPGMSENQPQPGSLPAQARGDTPRPGDRPARRGRRGQGNKGPLQSRGPSQAGDAQQPSEAKNESEREQTRGMQGSQRRGNRPRRRGSRVVSAIPYDGPREGDQQPADGGVVRRRRRPKTREGAQASSDRLHGGEQRGSGRPRSSSRPRNAPVQRPGRLSGSALRRRTPDERYTFSPPPSIPIATNEGIKARSHTGSFSHNWWARRWIEAMEGLVLAARLQRGRSYARSGQVLSLQEIKNGVEARVQGSRPNPYRVEIKVKPLSHAQWEQVIDAMAEQALFTAQLLAGEMPASIEDAFEAAGVSLFPSKPGDLETSCSCPDWANPCKHVAATHYILGDRFDDDPFLLFRMRGRSQEQILDGLRQRRGDAVDELGEAEQALEAVPLLEDFMDRFWDPQESLDTFALTIRPPSMEMPLLKRLGEPTFLPGDVLQSLLRPVYETFTRSALRAAYSEEEAMESNPDEENGKPISGE